MPTPEEYRAIRKARKERRRERYHRLMKHVPAIESFCKLHGIEVREISGGYQYRIKEYIVNWNPWSNHVHIQYNRRGDDDTRLFDVTDEQRKRPRIFLALERLVSVAASKDGAAPTLKTGT